MLLMGNGGIPELPVIKQKTIQFYEASKIVCEIVYYQFTVENGIVIVKPVDEAKD